MTSTPTPPPSPVISYGVQWKIKKGCPTGGTDACLDRNSDGIVTIKNGEDESAEDELSPFHTQYKWSGVDISYDVRNPQGKVPLIGYKVSGYVFRYTETTSPNGGEPTYSITPVPYKLVGMSIESSNPNGDKPWVYPDEYPVDKKITPTQYGGVVLKNARSDSKEAGEYSSCGIDDGPKDDGIIMGSQGQVVSGYNYTDVFDQSEFRFIPFNSSAGDGNPPDVEVNDSNPFKFLPYEPSVKDTKGKAAPIYPMDSITAYLPDPRDSVTVTYNVTMIAEDKDGKRIQLINPVITIDHVVSQDTSSVMDQINYLRQYCNFDNPGNHHPDDMAEYYPTAYPYTLVNGNYGLDLGDTPSTRGTDFNEEPLQRGDIWYNPETNERKYWSVADVPTELKINHEGSKYRDKTGVDAIWRPETKKKCQSREKMPFGLMVDIKTLKGKVIEVKMNEESTPQNFKDGDVCTIASGDYQATIVISITNESQWVNYYIDQF